MTGAVRISRRNALGRVAASAGLVTFLSSLDLFPGFPLENPPSSDDRKALLKKLQEASVKANKKIIQFQAEVYRNAPHYQEWDDEDAHSGTITVLNLLRRFHENWRRILEDTNVPRMVGLLKEIHTEFTAALEQELRKHGALSENPKRFEEKIGTDAYLSDFMHLLLVDAAHYLASQGLVFVPHAIGVYAYQERNGQTGETYFKSIPLLGFPRLFLVHDINPWELIDGADELKKEGIDILVVQPVKMAEGIKGIEGIERHEESLAEKVEGELGFEFDGTAVLFRRDFMNQHQDQCMQVIKENLESSALAIYVEEVSLKDAIEGFEIHKEYPVGIKIDGPVSSNIPNLSFAASYAAIKIMAKGAPEHVLNTQEPSTTYLLKLTAKTLAYHEFAHVKLSRSTDPVLRMLSWLGKLGKIVGLSAEESDVLDHLEELDVRLTAFENAPESFLIDALARNESWKKTGPVVVPADREIIWALIEEILHEKDREKLYGIKVDEAGLKVQPGKLSRKPGKPSEPEMTLDAETQVMAQLYRLVEKPERSKLLAQKVRKNVRLRERQETLVKKLAALDPFKASERSESKTQQQNR